MPSVWRRHCIGFCRNRGTSSTRMRRRGSRRSVHLREEFLRGSKVLPRRLGGHRGRGALHRRRVDFWAPCRIRRRCGLCSCDLCRGLGDRGPCSRRAGRRSLLLFRRVCPRGHGVRRHGRLRIESVASWRARRHALGAAAPLPHTHIERIDDVLQRPPMPVFYGG